MIMDKLLFLHGFFASGKCIPAQTLRNSLGANFDILTPDLSIHPQEAMQQIHHICADKQPQLLVGNSCGAFYAQMVAAETGIPALLGNPHFQMTEFLKERIGNHQFKSERADGIQSFCIDEKLITEFEEIQSKQWNIKADKDKVWGLFGEKDQIAHFEPEFLRHYKHSYHFPGGHTPTEEEVKNWYIPLIEKMYSKFIRQQK